MSVVTFININEQNQRIILLFLFILLMIFAKNISDIKYVYNVLKPTIENYDEYDILSMCFYKERKFLEKHIS